MSRIHLSPPDVGDLELDAVSRAMASGWIAPAGPDVDAFESETAAVCGVAHGVATNSGTAALHLALLACGVGPGDTVPTSTLTFAATPNAITYTGATPVFVDVEPATGNIDPIRLDHAITALRAAGARVPAVVTVDLLGHCVDHGAIAEVAARHGTQVISDAAESMGSTQGGRPAGSFGAVAIISFNGNKIMTTSGGGMALTDAAATAARIRHLASQAREPAVHYEHREIGYNYRLSNVLAALGRAQLSRLDEFVKRRREVREWWSEILDLDGVAILHRPGDEEDNCWLTAAIVDAELTGWSATDLVGWLGRHDVDSRPLWKPMHQQPVYASHAAYVDGTADRLFRTGIILPSGSALTPSELQRLRRLVERFLGGAR